MLNTRAKLEIAGGAVALILAGWLVFAWTTERENRVRAEATAAANKNAQAIIERHDAENKAQLDAFVKGQQAQMDALNKRLDQVKTPQDLAPLVEQLMSLQKPITFVTPPATAENPKPQPIAQVPTQDAPQVKAYVQACETCKLDLETEKQKLTYAEQQHTNDLQSLKIANDNAAAWEKAAKGGSILQRMKHDGKIGLIGGAAAIVIVCALGHCPR